MSKLLELTVKTEFNGQQCINRFNYVMTGTPAAVTPSFGLVSAAGFIPTAGAFPTGTLAKSWSDLVSADVQFDLAVSLNPYDPTDFYGNPFVPVVNGAVTGNSLSPTAAFGFLSTQTNRGIRHGTKRFTGVTESENLSGGELSPETLVLMNDLADFMGNVITYDDEGNTLSYAPCVVKKDKYVVPGSDPERFAYRYFPPYNSTGEALQLASLALSILWSPYDHTRTQASRQYGRGI